MVFGFKKIILGLVVGLVSTIFFGHSLSYAQTAEDITTFSNSLNALDIDLSSFPENPGAFQEVSFSLDSNVVDLNRYPISWFVNGAVQKSGIGARKFTTTTGAYGSQSTLQVAIEVDGEIIRKSITLSPRDITILWEAINSYVPPFYLGKKLPSREALIRVSVNPYQKSGGGQPTPEQGIYVWKRNGTPVGDESGYGKNSFTFRHNRIRGNEAISVTTSDLKNSIGGVGNITIPFFNPQILLYEKDSVTGITHPQAKRTTIMPETKKTIVAEPYFFSLNDQGFLDLSTRWTMNGQPLAVTNRTLTFQNPGSSGNASITVAMENMKERLQTATAQMTILFQN